MKRPTRKIRFLALIGLALATACASVLVLAPSAPPWLPSPQPAGVRLAPRADPSPETDVGETEAPVSRLSPCANTTPDRQAFFGDLHVHTHYSMDARSRAMLGTPDDAYRFARGEAIGLGPFDTEGVGGRTAQLERPLDFAAVTDHAEWIGEVRLCGSPGSSAYDTESCRTYRGETETKSSIPGMKFTGQLRAIMGLSQRKEEICGEDSALCRASLRTAWQDTQAATERWNDDTSACSFTTFHGWEHSYSVAMSKVHRNVIFRNAIVPELPISSLETPDAVDLWDQLDAQCANTGTGCEAVTIPHNANVSNGRLFEVTWKREAMEEQRRRASLRARYEPIVEMMQVKGESECKNGLFDVLGGEDELCNFEKIRGIGDAAPADCKRGTGSGALGGLGCQSRVDFARYALIEGFAEEERIGVNPFQFGFIGSTDGHNANPGDVEEDSYQGCCANDDTTVLARLNPQRSFAGQPAAARNPGGLVGVWAPENRRDALFEAIQRRETFATSGPRIEPRFFGGFDLPADLCESGDLVSRADAAGVPMGGLLSRPIAAAAEAASWVAPTFVAMANRDPGTEHRPGTRLDRLQIIKVWLGEDGEFHQAVHDIAGRRLESPARAKPEVDLLSCQPEGTGAESLCGTWQDPDFDPSRSAAYYVRVVEDPTCRWSWRQCLMLPEGERPSTCASEAFPRTIQERAWTSPIWFEPAG